MTLEAALAQPPIFLAPDAAFAQQSALLRTTLARIKRYTQQMTDDLEAGELNIAHADQLGQAVLTALRESALISARAEVAARSVA